MRSLNILRTIVNILFIFAIIGIIFGLPLIFMIIVLPEQVPFKIDQNTDYKNIASWELAIILILLFAGSVFFVYGLYLFKKVLALFSKRIIFDNRVIILFNQIGKAILIGYGITFASSVFLWISKIEIELKITFGWSNALFIIGIGLFFIVLAEVFQIAKNMKEENELTV